MALSLHHLKVCNAGRPSDEFQRQVEELKSFLSKHPLRSLRTSWDCVQKERWKQTARIPKPPAGWHYIYALREPWPGGQVKYVGVTKVRPLDRLKGHKYNTANNKTVSSWLENLDRFGHGPPVVEVLSVVNWWVWAHVEKLWIAKMGGPMRPGGNGLFNICGR